MTPVDSAAPVGEKGTISPEGSLRGWPQLPGWSTGDGTAEYVPELIWPNSVITYDRMTTDAQIAGLWHAATWPIRRYSWRIDPRNADPATVDNLCDDLGLRTVGEELDGRPIRFDFGQHLQWALKALVYGHYPFEMVGEIVNGQWRLRKLAPRPPHTIEEWVTDNDGGLKAIKQDMGTREVTLKVDRLVLYVWDQEPGVWVGRSMLRALYKSWMLKDQLMRIDAINHERAGGMPFIEAPPGASQRVVDALSEMAQNMRVGDQSGGAAPAGSKLQMPGPNGSDVIGSIRYHDELMARAWLMMFMQLGQTRTGSRALGEAFIDWFDLAQETIGYWFADTFTRHVIGDYFAYNVGEDAPLPMLTFEREGATLATEDLVALVNAGVVVVDENLETQVRQDAGLPPSATPGAVRQEPPPVTPAPRAPAALPPRT